MSTLRIRLFGRLRVERDGCPLSGLRGAKVQELLAYLLLHRRRSHLRESLADLLWHDSSAATAKKHLRQTLWQLQSALVHENEDDPTILVNEPEWIGVALAPEVWLDVARLEEAYHRVEGIPGRDLDAEQAALLRAAVELYSGDLLDGCYQDWCLFERERLQNQYLTLLNKLIGYAEHGAEYESGLGYATRILHLDHAHERAHRRMMRLHWLRGDRTAALRQYATCQRALDEELGVAPSAETTRLYEELCRSRPTLAPVEEPMVVEVVRFAPGRLEPRTDTSSLPDLFHGLSRVETELETLLGYVRQELRSFERILDPPH